MALYGLVVHLGQGGGLDVRIRGIGGFYMTVAGILMVVGLLIVAQLLVATKDPHTRRLVFLGVSGVLVIGALLGTYTRGSWIGFAAGLVLLLRKRWALLLGALIVGFLFLALGPPDARDRVLSIADPSHPRNVERVLIWEHGLGLVKEHPWTGVGLEIPAELMHREKVTESGEVIRVHSHMHNAYLQIAVSMGLPALLVFLWMILAYLRMGGRAPRGGITNLWEEGLVAAYVPVVMALLVNGLFEWNFGDSEVLGLFYLLSGCVLGVESGQRR
jgi:O-antigen ligase